MKDDPRDCCLTCDVEIFSKEDARGFEGILDTLQKGRTKATFFIEMVKGNERIIKDCNVISKILDPGLHEIGLHIHWKDSRIRGIHHYSHEMFRGELAEAISLLPGHAQNIKSFRAGGLCCSLKMLEVLGEFGFSVDSSVAPRLNESGHWRQRHKKVPYVSWYFPDKRLYWKPARIQAERIGILEIPVSRLIPSWRFWRYCTLQPGNPLNPVIIRQRRSSPQKHGLLTVIMHSWGCGRSRGRRFPVFADQLKSLIELLVRMDFRFVTLQEVRRGIPGAEP